MTDREISDFVAGQIVATVCCHEGGESWCFHCFYLFLEEEELLLFKSSPGSRHGDMLCDGAKIAGAILPSSLNFAGLQGIQLQGRVVEGDAEFAARNGRLYHEKFPMGKDMPGKIWAIRLTTLKLTDNNKGFGYKKTWTQQDNQKEV
jgi:uncharacterized protein